MGSYNNKEFFDSYANMGIKGALSIKDKNGKISLYKRELIEKICDKFGHSYFLTLLTIDLYKLVSLCEDVGNIDVGDGNIYTAKEHFDTILKMVHEIGFAFDFEKKNILYGAPIDNIKFSNNKSYGILKRNDINYVIQLLDFDYSNKIYIRNLGKKAVYEIIDFFLKLEMEVPGYKERTFPKDIKKDDLLENNGFSFVLSNLLYDRKIYTVQDLISNKKKFLDYTFTMEIKKEINEIMKKLNLKWIDDDCLVVQNAEKEKTIEEERASLIKENVGLKKVIEEKESLVNELKKLLEENKMLKAKEKALDEELATLGFGKNETKKR